MINKWLKVKVKGKGERERATEKQIITDWV